MTSASPPRAVRTLMMALGLTAVSTIFAQRLSSSEPVDQETARLVTEMIPKYHLSRGSVDDKISEKLVDGFVKDLDPQKLYFLQADVDEFNKKRTQLDDDLLSGDVKFAYAVFDRYRERLLHQTEVAQSLIDVPHDFTLDESITIDPKELVWSKTQEELDDRWRKRIKYDLLQFKLDEDEKKAKAAAGGATATDKATAAVVEDEDPKERLHKRYRNQRLSIEQMNDVDKLEIYLTALTECFDPHSSYMSPNTWEDFEIQMRLSLDGIGAALRADDGYTIVASIVPGGAADKDSRLKVGDKIIGVGQGEGAIEDIFEVKLSDVVRKIRGERGTIVRLQVQPAAGGETGVYDLVRQKIELKESAVKGEIIDASKRIGRKGKIGIISVPSFYRDFAGAQGGDENFKSAAADVALVLDEFATQHAVDAVVIDLRRNGGGALSEAIELSGHFIDQGPVVQVKEPNGRVRALPDDIPGVLYAGPLVVVCDRLSASASEIFAGVIKDYRRGIIVGDTTTHGKGTVQNLMDVAPNQMFRIFNAPQRGKLKLTIQQFYRVNGDSTQNRGVRSDIVLPSRMDHWDLGESFLDNALPFDQIQPARHSEGRLVNSEIIAGLQKASEKRVAAGDEFQKIEKAIQRDLERKSRKTVSLNEEQLRQERQADEEAKKEIADEEEALEQPPTDGPVLAEGFYNDELLHIAVDYAELFPRSQTVRR